MLDEEMKEPRARLLNAVKTPLGFFSLVILVSEAVLLAVLFSVSPKMHSIVVVAMVGLLFVTTMIVAVLCFRNPRSFGMDTHSEQKVNVHQPIKGAADGYAKYEGHYECYHKSTSEEPTVIRSHVHITFGTADKPVRFESFGYKYKGALALDDNNVYLFLDGDGHTEHMLLIFNEPLTPEFDVLTGIFAAVTEKRVPVVGKILWRKSPTPTTCARIRLKEIDPRIGKFLDQEGNPMVVQKPSLLLFEELEI